MTPSEAQVKQRRGMSALRCHTRQIAEQKKRETQAGAAKIEGGQAEINAYLLRRTQR